MTDTINAAIGIPRELTFANIRGAFPSFANAQSIRDDAYMAVFAADKIEVRRTAFMAEAANANPARLKTRVNGLIETLLIPVLSRFGSV